jgi:hypothetical protein
VDDIALAQARLGRTLDRARAGEDPALAARVREDGERLVKLLNGVLGMARLHSLGNHAFDPPVRDLAASLARLVELLGTVHLLAVEDQVYVNDIRIRLEGTAAVQDLGGKLRRHRIGGLSFHSPLSETQIRGLVACLAAEPAPARPRAAVQASLSAKGMEAVELAGIHRFRVSGEKETAPVRSATVVACHTAALIDESWTNLAANRLPNPLPLRRAVNEILERGGGVVALAPDPLGTSPFAAHTLRVCRLSVLLGRALGLAEGALQDLGVAAMFHDVGYAAHEGRDGEPAGGQAPPFSRHPVAGARLILRQRGFHEAKVRRALAALHHHRRYDDPRGRPALFGRILAIAEDYDAWVRAGGVSPADVLGRMARASGTVYDPVLLQLFINNVGHLDDRPSSPESVWTMPVTPELGGDRRALFPGVLPEVLRELVSRRPTGVLHLTRAGEQHQVSICSGTVVDPAGYASILSAADWTDGAYAFALQPAAAASAVSAVLPTRRLILDVVRRPLDPDIVQFHLGDLGRVVVRSEEPEPTLALTALEAHVLANVDGARTARAVLACVPRDVREAKRGLLALLCADLVRFKTA